MTLKRHEFNRIEKKLELQCRNSFDRIAWFCHEGKKILKTRRSHQKGDLPAAHKIRNQLKLNESQFKDLISCELSKDGYIEILIGAGYIQK